MFSLPNGATLCLQEKFLDFLWIGRNASLGCLPEDCVKVSSALLSGCLGTALALSNSLVLLLAVDACGGEECGCHEYFAAQHIYFFLCYSCIIN